MFRDSYRVQALCMTNFRPWTPDSGQKSSEDGIGGPAANIAEIIVSELNQEFDNGAQIAEEVTSNSAMCAPSQCLSYLWSAVTLAIWRRAVVSCSPMIRLFRLLCRCLFGERLISRVSRLR